MNIEKKVRFEQLKRANKERQRKKEIEKNVLLLECMEALGTGGKVLEKEKKNIVYGIFKKRLPFLPCGIDWKQFDLYYKIYKLEDIFEKCKCKEFYIIWCDELPIIISDIATIITHIEDVSAVEFDTWLFSVDYREIIEFHHDLGITYGVVNKS